MSEGTIEEVTESRVNTRISGKQSDENGLKAACAEDSYRRLGQMKAPGYLSWSHENRSQLVRIPAAIGEYRRAELRSPDQLANPYLAFALLISVSFSRDGYKKEAAGAKMCSGCIVF